ncbi:MAG: SLC13 family permease [Gemmatimonadota bacterium]
MAVRDGISRRQRMGLALGLVLFVAILLFPSPADLGAPGWRVAALGALMAAWWLTEAIPIPATALLPIVFLPLLGAGTVREATAPYANPIIFLFMGGFLIALGMQRWSLHRRIALEVLRRAGTRPTSLVGGFMGATAFLSLWVSNTATAMMMLPIGLSVLEIVERPDSGLSDPQDRHSFGVLLMLGIAFSASIGGFGTLVGTPPNALLAGFMLETYSVDIGFARWLLVGIPLVVLSLPIAFWLLTRVAFPIRARELEGGRRLIQEQLSQLGPMSRGEKSVAAVFACTASLWVLRPLLQRWIPGVSDAGIAMGGGLSLFLLPVDWRRGEFALDWTWAERLPWGVLFLFGGGLSLASAVGRTRLNAWIGNLAGGLSHWPVLWLVLLITLLVVLLTEFTSNTATAAAFLPVLGAVAVKVGWNPLLVTVPATLAASCAFMLPVATPPNAIVYGSGRITVGEMAKAGLLLDLVLILLVTGVTLLLGPVVFGPLSTTPAVP